MITMYPAMAKSHGNNSIGTSATLRSGIALRDLEHWHLQSFFDLLDTNDGRKPSINIDHFIRGCTRLRCNVKNIDFMAASHEQQYTSEKRYLEMRNKVDAVQNFLMSPDKCITNVTDTLM